MLIAPDTDRLPPGAGFLVVDGVNGAGKGTLLSKLIPFLEAQGRKVTSTREPGGTPLGAQLRALLLEEKVGKVAPLTEALLFAADRAEHVAKKIRPALQSGSLVVSDRYYYSSVAFQGYGRELGAARVRDLNRVAVDGMLPDLTLLLDLDPAEGLKRARKRSESAATSNAAERDGFEREELAFHKRLREGFLEMAREYPEPFLVVDAGAPADEVFSFVLPVINTWLKSVRS